MLHRLSDPPSRSLDHAGSLRALWLGRRQSAFTPDAAITDATVGTMTPRGFGALRAALVYAIPDHQCFPVAALCGRDACLTILAHIGTRDRPGTPADRNRGPLRWLSAAVTVSDQTGIRECLILRDQAGPGDQVANTAHAPAGSNPATVGLAEAATGSGSGSDWSATYAELLTSAMMGDFSVFHRAYDPAVALDLPAAVRTSGRVAADRFWLGLRGALPWAEFSVLQEWTSERPLCSPLVGLRWSLRGEHAGWGRFGRPTGKPVHLTGISLAEFGPRGLRRETTIFDDLSVWNQIAG